jgi:hypothetical protein
MSCKYCVFINNVYAAFQKKREWPIFTCDGSDDHRVELLNNAYDDLDSRFHVLYLQPSRDEFYTEEGLEAVIQNLGQLHL